MTIGGQLENEEELAKNKKQFDKDNEIKLRQKNEYEKN